MGYNEALVNPKSKIQNRNRRWRGLLVIGTLFALFFVLFSSFRPAQAQTPTCTSPYTVQPGEYWTGIARKCSVTFAALQVANQALWNRVGANIQVGDQLAIPGAAPAPKPTATVAASSVVTPSGGATVTNSAQPVRRDCPVLTAESFAPEPQVVQQAIECQGLAGAQIVWQGLGLKENFPWSAESGLQTQGALILVDEANPTASAVTLFADIASGEQYASDESISPELARYATPATARQYALLTLGPANSSVHSAIYYLLFARSGKNDNSWHFAGAIASTGQGNNRQAPSWRILHYQRALWLVLNEEGAVAGATWVADRWFSLQAEPFGTEALWYRRLINGSVNSGVTLVNAIAHPQISTSSTISGTNRDEIELTVHYEMVIYPLSRVATPAVYVVRQAVYQWDAAANRFVFNADLSNVSEEQIGAGFSFSTHTELLRFAFAEVRDQLTTGSPATRTLMRDYLKVVEDSPEKRALLSAR
jgi:LysM repeat protein